MRNLKRTASIVVLAWTLAGLVSPAEGEVLPCPTIKDMIYLGQGPNHTAYVDAIIKVGHYVYASGCPGWDTIDVSDPNNLQRTSSWNSGTQMHGLAAIGNILYVSNWSPGSGLQVFDRTNPAVPTYLRTVTTDSHTWSLEIYNGMLFVALDSQNPPTNGYNIYDISNPAYPNLRGYLNAYTGNPTAHLGEYLYFANRQQVYIYRQPPENPYAPQYVGLRYINALLQHVAVYNGYLYVAGINDRDIYPLGGIHVYSLANPASPQKTDYWPHEVTDMHFQGQYCVAPASGSGVYTLNLSDPAHPYPFPCHDRYYLPWDDDGDGITTTPPDFHDGYPISATGAGNYAYIGTSYGPGDSSSPYWGGRVYCVQIAQGEDEVPVEDVWVDLGSPDIESGIAHPRGGDADTEPVTKGGRVCRQNAVPGDDSYFMFQVSDSYAYAGSKPNLYIGIYYFDEGSGYLRLDYDSPGGAVENKYKNGGTVSLTGTNTWKLHVFHVTDAYFANRQNLSADFRIYGGVPSRFYLDEVYVAEASPTPQMQLSLATLEASTYYRVDGRSDAFVLRNTGGGKLWYSATDDANWLATSPSSGAVSDQEQVININYDTSALAVGDYAATITVTDPNALNSPRTIDVAMHVLVAGDLDEDDDVDQEDFGEFQTCMSGSGILHEAGCEKADFDGDLDVDRQDFMSLEGCMGGAEQSPGC